MQKLQIELDKRKMTEPQIELVNSFLSLDKSINTPFTWTEISENLFQNLKLEEMPEHPFIKVSSYSGNLLEAYLGNMLMTVHWIKNVETGELKGVERVLFEEKVMSTARHKFTTYLEDGLKAKLQEDAFRKGCSAADILNELLRKRYESE